MCSPRRRRSGSIEINASTAKRLDRFDCQYFVHAGSVWHVIMKEDARQVPARHSLDFLECFPSELVHVTSLINAKDANDLVRLFPDALKDEPS